MVQTAERNGTLRTAGGKEKSRPNFIFQRIISAFIVSHSCKILTYSYETITCIRFYNNSSKIL